MAKSNKPTQRPKTSPPRPASSAAKAAPAAAVKKAPFHPRFERPSNDSPADPLLRKIFWGLAIAGALLLVVLSLGSGINADDKFQADYSEELVNYYGTFGKDTTALAMPDGYMHLYGGFFETVTGFANKALGFEKTEMGYHHVRHVSSALLGWVAILCAALLARLIGGWRTALFTLILLLLSPRFVGDSLMNPKDIPFAAGYMLAIYNMAAVLDRMPRPRRWNLIGLVAGLAIALGLRAGGLLAFGIWLLFAALHFLGKNGFAGFGNRRLLGRYALIGLGVAVASYILALLFWPFGMQAPIKNPFFVLSRFSDFDVKIRVLYEGVNVMSDKTPWHYPIKWMLFTIPLAVIAGLLGSLAMAPQLWRRYNPLWVGLALFAGIFPVFYLIYKKSVIYDGWRHLTFVYPPLVVVAGLFWNALAERFSARKTVQYAIFGVMALLLADAAYFIAANPKIPYVYFNPVNGGIQGAYGKFETDYWGVSTRQGVEWLESQGILKPDMPEKIILATNMFFSTKQLTAKYGDKVVVKYLKWEKRCDDAWDYALYPTRFIDGATLERGLWPPDNAAHIVQANGVPILAVLKSGDKNCALGMASAKLGDWKGAADRLQQEVAAVPDNDLAWANLAQAYLNSDRPEEAKAAAEKALDISPDDTQASNVLGMYWMYKNDSARAKSQFESALKREPNNPSAWYYLAVIANTQEDNQTALNNLMKAIQLAPNFKPAYEFSARIYEGLGDNANAQRFRDALKQIK